MLNRTTAKTFFFFYHAAHILHEGLTNDEGEKNNTQIIFFDGSVLIFYLPLHVCAHHP